MKKSRQNTFATIILVFFLFLGMAVMAYPSFSDWWNARSQSYIIAGYDLAVAELDDDTKEKMMEEAYAYNERLTQVSDPFRRYLEAGDYASILDIAGNGVIGYVTIPRINIELPIYHGTSAEVLNIAIGHLQGSSFPVGGTNTHAVISGHRGLPSAKLFTDIDQLVEGDTFTITVLDTVLTYEVEQIMIILPDEVDKISLISGGDYVTLMTCTPYGINSHRLLVRAHRIETVYEKTIKVSADALMVETGIAVPIIAAPLFLLLLAYWLISGNRKKRRKQKRIQEREVGETHES